MAGQLCMYVCTYVCTHGRAVEIRTPTHWNLIGRLMTVQPIARLTVYVRCFHLVMLPFPCKVHPRTGHEGAEVELWYSCTLSLTSALDGSGWSSPRPGRFTPG